MTNSEVDHLHRNGFRRGSAGVSGLRCLRVFFRRAIVLLVAILFSFGGIAFGQKKQKLEKHFREWLERDVAYIITKDERDIFLKLTTDDAREKFIETFWEIRNPSPGSPTNSYKDEIYQRIAFADARFGIGSGVEGWRTDRGRTYITLGPPQQKQVFRNSANLYPIEIWFYGGANSALPPFFYVMFYQREGGGEYRFYSPYTDGPDKLITGVEAINSRLTALRLIRNSVGPEVARISLSLLPDEPVDETTGIVSLESDILLNSIKNLANLPANRDDILRRKTNRETVTFSSENKLIFTQQKSLSDSMTKKRFETIKDKVFGYEGTLPLPPAKYHLEFQFTDWSKKAAFHTVREILIPLPANDSMVVPGVLPFLSAENADPALAELMPFTIGGVQFTPMPSSTPTLAPGTNLQVVYQIWTPPSDPRGNLGKKLDVEYAFGRPAVPGSATKVKDEISREQFDAAGSLVTGKKLSLDQQSSGSYILNVTVNNPETKHNGFGTLNFKVLDAPSPPEPWDVIEPGIAQDAEKGILDQQRGLCYWALGQFDEARVWFRRALQLDNSNDVARARLVDAYFSKMDYAAVVSLFSDVGVTETTDSETLLRIATSLEKRGSTSQAISVIENALQSRPEEGPLYLALAQYYSEIGNARKAAELTQRGKSYSTTDSTKH